MCEEAVEEMTARLTGFADAALTKTDMCVKLSKTYNQHLQPLQQVSAATDEEVAKKMASYKHECEFAKAGCTQRFKTKADMRIHSCNCDYNYYGLTDENQVGSRTYY